MRSTPVRHRITIRLAGGGIDRIEVIDNGCGMARDEMGLALERHATSKLPDENIEAVATLGFRGEALPSIASVARLTLESRAATGAGAGDGWARTIDNGELADEGPAALPPGTRVDGRAVCFARVPARRKFLRTARSEYAAAADAIRRLAMARPDIGFTLEHDGRKTIAVQPGQDGTARVAALTNRELAGTTASESIMSAKVCGSKAWQACRPSTAASPTTNICSSTAGR